MGILIKGENDLLTWCINHGERGKQLQHEWTGETDKGEQLTLEDISYGSHKKIKWKCRFGHFWYDTVIHRTWQDSRNCTVCSAMGTSYPEQFLYWALKQIYPTAESRPRVLKSQENPQGIEFDIAIAEIPLAIEYSPTYWHDGREDKTKIKKALCKDRNIRFIEIIDDTYNELEHIFTPDYICIKTAYSKIDKQLEEILDYILKSLRHSIQEINLYEARQNAIAYSSGKIEYEKSLEYKYPDLAKEWNNEKNKIAVKDIKPGSNLRAFWHCNNCGYGSKEDWVITVINRVSRKSGCPACGYNWYDKTCHKTYGTSIVTKDNGLIHIFPQIVAEYHKSLNQYKIEELTVKSNKEIYWQCTKCGYGKNGEWLRKVHERTYRKTGCPACGYNIFDNKIHKTSKKVVAPGVNDLKSKFPELAKEWHPTLNDIKPENIKSGANRKVYWQCTKCGYGKNGEWQATPNRRTAKGYETGCPKCKYKWFKQTSSTGQNNKPTKNIIPGQFKL